MCSGKGWQWHVLLENRKGNWKTSRASLFFLVDWKFWKYRENCHQPFRLCQVVKQTQNAAQNQEGNSGKVREQVWNIPLQSPSENHKNTNIPSTVNMMMREEMWPTVSTIYMWLVVWIRFANRYTVAVTHFSAWFKIILILDFCLSKNNFCVIKQSKNDSS